MSDSDASGRSSPLATLGFHSGTGSGPNIGGSVERESEWIKAGWYLAFCLTCSFEMPFKTAEERDDWANTHTEGTGHYIDRIDGKEL